MTLLPVEKHPDENSTVVADFTSRLSTGEVLDTVSVVEEGTTDLTFGAVNVSPLTGTASVLISGGKDNTDYNVIFTAFTTANPPDKIVECGVLRVRSC